MVHGKTKGEGMSGVQLIREESNNKDKVIMQIIVTWLSVVSVFYGYFSVFRWNTNSLFFMASTIPVTALAHFVVFKTYSKKVKTTVMAVGAIALIALTLISIKGVVPFLNDYLERRSVYYSIEGATLEENATGTEIYLFLVLVEIVVTFILCGVLKKKRFGIIAAVIFIMPAIIQSSVGKLPTTMACALLILAAVLYRVEFRNTGSAGRNSLLFFVAVSMVFALLFGVGYVSQPRIEAQKIKHEKAYKKIRSDLVSDSFELKIQEFVDGIIAGNGNYARGGIGKGNLKKISSIRPSGKKAMEVVVNEKPKDMTYLKAFVGAIYYDDQWREVPKSSIEKVLTDDNIKRKILGNTFEMASELDGDIKKFNIQINLKGASSEYSYMPYYCKVEDNMKPHLDATVESKNKKKFDYNYYTYRDLKIIGLYGDEDDYLWRRYSDYVKTTYTVCPSENNSILSFAGEIVQEYGEYVYDYGNEFGSEFAQPDMQIVDMIETEIGKKFSEEGYKYSLSPGKVPEDASPLSYFLEKSKKGFCVHFATAATLAYRLCSIPARYVEGYAIAPEEFKEQKDGTYKAEVTDAMAHAWCETFDDNYGWIVREHTPGYTGRSDKSGGVSSANTNVPETTDGVKKDENPVSQAESQTKPQTKPQVTTENKTEVSKDTKSNYGSKKDEVFVEKNGAIKPIECILLIVLLLVVVLVQAKIRHKKKIASFMRKKGNVAVTCMFAEMCRICMWCGVSKEKMSDEKFVEEIKKKFPQLSEAEWQWIYECAKMAAFGPNRVDIEDRKRMYNLYRKFRSEILKNQKGLKKVIFLYLLNF